MTNQQLSVTDLFGNLIEVTDLAAAIKEREMCVNANVDFYTEPFKYQDGCKKAIPERAAEKIPMASYHADLLNKLLAIKQEQVLVQVQPELTEEISMPTQQRRSNTAYSAVLAHASYACLESETFETQLRELVVGLKVLCDEYGVDFDEAAMPVTDGQQLN